MAKTSPKKAPVRRAPRKRASSAAPPPSPQGWPSALAKAQQEGANLFESILKQGQRLEQRTKQAAADTAAAARGAATAKAREMQQIAGGTWDKLEQVFEDRVARALSKLGIYTQNDIQRLADRVDELSEAVNRLLKAKGAAKAPAKRARKS
jgi:poly(hydroxyalkanoate) granule-associated protein